MLLYRVVPDQYGMILNKSDKGRAFNLQGLTTEDLFYKLGYINVSKHAPYFYTEENDDTKWQFECDGISFFTSPWDALHSFIDIEGNLGHHTEEVLAYFSNSIVRIQEYDIPDEIVEVSHQGGDYRGVIIKGNGTRERDIVKIPIELLKGEEEIQEELTDELKSELSVLAFLEGNKSLDKLADLVYRDNEELNKKRKFYVKREKFFFKYQFLKEEVRTKLDELRFSNAGVFFKSGYITGRELLITLDEYMKFRKKEAFEPLFETGMFSLENLKEYRNKQKEKTMVLN